MSPTRISINIQHALPFEFDWLFTDWSNENRPMTRDGIGTVPPRDWFSPDLGFLVIGAVATSNGYRPILIGRGPHNCRDFLNLNPIRLHRGSVTPDTVIGTRGL
jgi:hypothetical protein